MQNTVTLKQYKTERISEKIWAMENIKTNYIEAI